MFEVKTQPPFFMKVSIFHLLFDSLIGLLRLLFTPYKVTKMTGTGTNLRPLGILLRDVRAKDENGEIMALRHKELPIMSVQFHPESIGSPNGIKLLENFLTVNRMVE